MQNESFKSCKTQNIDKIHSKKIKKPLSRDIYFFHYGWCCSIFFSATRIIASSTRSFADCDTPPAATPVEDVDAEAGLTAALNICPNSKSASASRRLCALLNSGFFSTAFHTLLNVD